MQTDLSTSLQKGASGTSDTVWGGTDAASGLFTKLLVAQIKNQDPLEPTNPSEFVSQLTQLSEMESLQKLTSQVIANSRLIQGMQAVALGAQIGSLVTVMSDHVVLAEQPVPARIMLDNASSQVTLVLAGPDGSERRVALGAGGPGSLEYLIDPVKLGLAPGSYTLRVETDSGEIPFVELTGELTKVILSAAGTVSINVANVGDVLPDALTEFNGRQMSTTN